MFTFNVYFMSTYHRYIIQTNKNKIKLITRILEEKKKLIKESKWTTSQESSSIFNEHL